MKRIIPLLLGLLLSLSLTAQTTTQKGTVRLITHSATSPVTPVAGVKVIVGNTLSGPTSKSGAFSVQVPDQFQVSGISGGDYLLALPMRNSTYYASKNSVEVVVVSRQQRDEDYKRLYTELKKKYRAQTRELNRARQECRDLVEGLSQGDAAYAAAKARLDSLQALYLRYLNNEEEIEQEIKDMAEGLAITDYRTLDSLERRIYDLKSAGDWSGINSLVNRVTRNDARGYLREGVSQLEEAQRRAAAAQLREQEAERDLLARFVLMEEAIKAFKMQHLNDSVARYYDILVAAAPDNWGFLFHSAVFERSFMARYPKALERFLKALDLKPGDSLQAECHNHMALVYEKMKDYTQARRCLDQALALGTRLGNSRCLAATHFNLGNIAFGMRQLDQARQHYGQYFALLDQADDSYPLDAAAYHDAMGKLLIEQGSYPQALTHCQEALRLIRHRYGPEDYHLAAPYYKMGVSLYRMGQYDQALACCDSSLAIHLAALGENHPILADIYNTLGAIYGEKEDSQHALQYYEQAYAIALLHHGEGSPQLVPPLFNIGTQLLYLDEHARALATLRQAEAIVVAHFGDQHPMLGSIWCSMGGASQGDDQQELAYYLKGLAVQQATLGEQHPEVGVTYMNIGAVYHHMGQLPKALEYTRKAHRILHAALPAGHPYLEMIDLNLENLLNE